MIGAALLAQTALNALAGSVRQRSVALFRPVRQAVAGKVTLKQERAGDADARSAGGTIIAAAAELGAQAILYLLHLLPLLLGQGRGIRHGGGVFFYLFWLCHAGDNQCHVGIGCNIAQCQAAIFNSTASQGLHADEADVLLGALSNQLLRLIFHNVIREHDGFHPIELQQAAEHLHRVGSHTNVANLSGLLCFQHGLQCAAGSKNLVKGSIRRVMELVKVNVIGAQIVQTAVNVRCHLLFCGSSALGGKNKMLPNALQRKAQIFLADGVAAGGIDIVHALRHHHPQQLPRPQGINALNGDAAEANPGHPQAGFSKNPIFHFHNLLIFQAICFSHRPPPRNPWLRPGNRAAPAPAHRQWCCRRESKRHPSVPRGAARW